MGVDAGIDQARVSEGRRAEIRKAWGFDRDSVRVERLTRPCPTCFALPSRWCKAGFTKRFSDATGFLHEER